MSHTESLRERTRNNLIAKACEHLHLERAEAALIPLPGQVERYIAVGTADEIVKLLPGAAGIAVPTDVRTAPVDAIESWKAWGLKSGIPESNLMIDGGCDFSIGEMRDLYLEAFATGQSSAKSATASQEGETGSVQATLEQIAQSWDGCMFDAPGEMMDIGASLRRQFKQIATPTSTASTQAAAEARNAALEEAAKACNAQAIDVVMKSDITFNRAVEVCATAIRALKSLPAVEDKAVGQDGGGA